MNAARQILHIGPDRAVDPLVALVTKESESQVDMIKLTNLLDEAKCYEVIRQLRWPDGAASTAAAQKWSVTTMTIASGTDSDTCARHAGIASMT